MDGRCPIGPTSGLAGNGPAPSEAPPPILRSPQLFLNPTAICRGVIYITDARRFLLLHVFKSTILAAGAANKESGALVAKLPRVARVKTPARVDVSYAHSP